MNTETPRILPSDEQAEQSVLGAVLLDNAAFDTAAEELKPEDFVSDRHRLIWQAMSKLRLAGQAIDSITLSDELRMQGSLDLCGGSSYLAECLLAVVSASETKRHAGIVRKTKLLRELIWLGNDLSTAAYEQQDPAEIIERISRRIFDVAWGRVSSPWRSMDEVIGEAMQYVSMMEQRGGELAGWTSGLLDLDRMLGGFMPTDLVIVGARPSMGKTALACGIILSASAAGAKVAMLSLEMSRTQLGLRFLGYQGRVDISDIRTGRVRYDQSRGLVRATEDLLGRLVWLDDSGYMTMDQVRTKSRQLKQRDGLDILVIDYLQLLAGTKGNDRYRQITDISRELKLLAKELNITVIALSQLSRELERREDKRPILSDLRESGAIEQDADIVLFLYRDEVYNLDNSPEKGIAEIIIRKHRNGPVGTVKVVFEEQFARFDNLSLQEPS